MGSVSDWLHQSILKQINEYGLVIWYDPEGHYTQAVAAPPSCTWSRTFNDGVVLNIAPLWEPVPWKEAEKYWEELMDGKYEWSSIGKQLREKGLVKSS